MDRIILTQGLPDGSHQGISYTFNLNMWDLLVNIPGTHQGLDSARVHFPEQELWLKSLEHPKLKHAWPLQFALEDEKALADFLEILAPVMIS